MAHAQLACCRLVLECGSAEPAGRWFLAGPSHRSTRGESDDVLVFLSASRLGGLVLADKSECRVGVTFPHVDREREREREVLTQGDSPGSEDSYPLLGPPPSRPQLTPITPTPPGSACLHVNGGDRKHPIYNTLQLHVKGSVRGRQVCKGRGMQVEVWRGQVAARWRLRGRFMGKWLPGAALKIPVWMGNRQTARPKVSTAPSNSLLRSATDG